MDKQISIMPCLDMQNGRVVKGVHFVDIRDAVEAGATVLLAASVFHFHTIDIGELKDYLRSRGVRVKQPKPSSHRE